MGLSKTPLGLLGLVVVAGGSRTARYWAVWAGVAQVGASCAIAVLKTLSRYALVHVSTSVHGVVLAARGYFLVLRCSRRKMRRSFGEDRVSGAVASFL